MALPGNWFPNASKRPVAGEQRHVLKGALGCKHAVEWVAVIDGVAAGPEGVQVGYRQMFKAIEFNEFVETGLLPARRSRVFRGGASWRFPTRLAALIENGIPLIANQALGMGGELWIVRPPPEQGMGVQQISHGASHA